MDPQQLEFRADPAANEVANQRNTKTDDEHIESRSKHTSSSENRSRCSNEKMREIVRVWLSTDLTEERHRRRVAKIDSLL